MTSTPAISTPVYTITPFNPNTAVLPNIVATNVSGYDVKFFPLTLNPVLGVDLVLEAMIGFNPAPNSWNSVADLSIPTAVQTLLGTFTSTELTCGINAELPEQVQSCNLSQIPQLLTDITNALSSSAFTDIGQSVLSL